MYVLAVRPFVYGYFGMKQEFLHLLDGGLAHLIEQSVIDVEFLQYLDKLVIYAPFVVRKIDLAQI